MNRIASTFILLLLCFAAFLPASAQLDFPDFAPAAFYRKSQEVFQDFNRDGYVDSMAIGYDGGSGYGMTAMYIVDGKTGKEFYVNASGPKWTNYLMVPAPAEFFQPGQEGYLRMVEKYLLTGRRYTWPEGALRWGVEHYRPGVEDYEESELFDICQKFRPYWYAGEPVVAGAYYVRMSPAKTRKWFDCSPEPVVDYEEGDTFRQGWLQYYGFSVKGRRGEVLAGDGGKVLHIHGGGIVVMDTVNNAHQWVMIHGGERFMRLDTAAMKGPLVFFQGTYGPDAPELAVIDIDLGICAGFRGACFGFELLANGVNVGTERHPQVILYEDIQAELRRLRR